MTLRSASRLVEGKRWLCLDRWGRGLEAIEARRWVDEVKCLSLFVNLDDGGLRIVCAGGDYCRRSKWKGDAIAKSRLSCGSGLF